MKSQSNVVKTVLRILLLLVLLSPFILAWLPTDIFYGLVPESASSQGYFIDDGFLAQLASSFQDLTITLVVTMVFAMVLSLLLGYVSVWSMTFGRGLSNILNAVESIPSILVALFMYAPVSGFLASHGNDVSSIASLSVFVGAATLTALPESVRSITIPLSDLYNRKYSISFRSYGFPKGKILAVLMNTGLMRNAVKRVAAGILLKTLVLDCSFGFIIQLGFGSNGTPAHLSPGALVATYRQSLMGIGSVMYFWLPTIMLVMISVAFLLVLNDVKEEL